MISLSYIYSIPYLNWEGGIKLCGLHFRVVLCHWYGRVRSHLFIFCVSFPSSSSVGADSAEGDAFAGDGDGDGNGIVTIAFWPVHVHFLTIIFILCAQPHIATTTKHTTAIHISLKLFASAHLQWNILCPFIFSLQHFVCWLKIHNSIQQRNVGCRSHLWWL